MKILAGIAIIFLGLIGAIVLRGGTFGARCAHAYPDSGLEQERCIERLNKGEMP